jgi:hypothetical protein
MPLHCVFGLLAIFPWKLLWLCSIQMGNGREIIKVEGMWKEALMAYFKVLHSLHLEGHKKNIM